MLQNPQDARTRSDVKLMNQVVNFLSLLAITEEQGGVKRMLGVCAEFERIARVVLDRADKESHSRRKRRSSKMNDDGPAQNAQQIPQKRPAPSTPHSSNAPTPQNVFTPGFNGDLNNRTFNPSLQGFSPNFSDMNLPVDFSGADFPNLTTPSNGMNGYQDLNMDGQQYSGDSFSMGSFQQPFVPQDLWQMPMTLEWDMAQLGDANVFPAFDPGQGQHQGQQHPDEMQGMSGP